jgi:hypothetical protein
MHLNASECAKHLNLRDKLDVLGVRRVQLRSPECTPTWGLCVALYGLVCVLLHFHMPSHWLALRRLELEPAGFSRIAWLCSIKTA